MTAQDVHGELQRENGLAIGWCWSPSHPRERLRVALLVDGRRHGATTAARLRLDLVRDGVRDGYHGFSLPLPVPLAAEAMLEAQELGTGRIFARVLGSEAPQARRWSERLASMRRTMRTLQEGLHAEAAASLKFRAAWPRGKVVAMRAAPARDGCAIPHPVVSLLLDAVPDGVGALRVIAAAMPVLAAARAELLVADDGQSAASATLAALSGVTVVRVMLATEIARIDALFDMAQGDLICVLRPAALHAASLVRLLRHAADLPEVVLMRMPMRRMEPIVGADAPVQPIPEWSMSPAIHLVFSRRAVSAPSPSGVASAFGVDPHQTCGRSNVRCY